MAGERSISMRRAYDKPTVVIDTNVWLDLLVFEDPSAEVLKNALQQRTLQAIASSEMLNELEEVLQRDAFVARGANTAQLMTQVKQWVLLVAVPADVNAPRCQDPDDQKFIDLAVNQQADFLLSKDLAVLKLAKPLLPCCVGPSSVLTKLSAV